MQRDHHHLIITDERGHTIRGKVVYLQPVAERTRKHEAAVHILSSDLLTYGNYQAQYRTKTRAFNGNFCFFDGKVTDDGYLLIGTFTVRSEEEEERPPG